MRVFAFLILCVLAGCGVKAPPIAPERQVEPVAPKLKCSPYDPECDRKDKRYKPQGTPR